MPIGITPTDALAAGRRCCDRFMTRALPGEDLLTGGVEDLKAGVVSFASLLVEIGYPRLAI
ncbi:MAG TPA: hypothetical protein VGB64_00245 [Actinomycetota bacterium]